MDAPAKSSKKHKKHKKHKDRDVDKDRDKEWESMSKRQKLKTLKKEIEQLSPEERRDWFEAATAGKVMVKKVVYKDREVTLGQLAEEVKQEEEQQSGGAVDYTERRKSSLDKVPGWELRPGAPKMQLRPTEEALLPLDLLGRGTLWSKRPLLGYLMGGCRDAGFGVYAKCGHLQHLLKERWAGHDPDEVLVNESFYNDIIKYGGKTELTLMAVPTRNISLPTLRKHVEQRMMQNLNVLANGQVAATDEEALKQLCDTLDSSYLSKSGFVKGDEVLAGTNFIFSTTKTGSFTAEAILPFKELKDRKTTYLWRNKHPNLTYAFWGMVLGPHAVSLDAKVNVGQGALYITNGFKFGDNPGNPNQVLITDPDNEPESPFPVPASAPTEGFDKDAFSISEGPEQVLQVLSSKQTAKHERNLQRNRDAPEGQKPPEGQTSPEGRKTKHQKIGKSKHRKGGK
ncbi:hypothetical protein ABBQ38_002961 [Trebouxia sp. C0009 RCD-2024]